ncbi:hypothetical protein [Xanthomonas campestris]|uniref:hypothetical protein n=1 Tax=Xanthomonas campestris TaxID=339 RepID=UPI0015A0E7AD|nr:hypothetical protein [Xanthomonas campestris]QLC71461.1 hypothetical protein AD14011_19385 [Xanthomonas campestris pv. raphani]
MTRNDALIEGIEFDLVHFHRRRMAERAGLQYQMLREERGKMPPDEERIASVRAAIADTMKKKFDTLLTVEEVVDPLRHNVDIRAINVADRFMADPVAWREPPCKRDPAADHVDWHFHTP